MKSILVSGSDGFIGSNLVTKLMGEGFNVEGLVKKKKNFDYTTHVCDLKNFTSITKIKSKYDCLIHLAGETEENNFQSMFSNNVVGTQNFLEFALRNNIKKFIFISAHNVYSPFSKLPISENATKSPNTNYGFTKLLSENLVEYYSKKFKLKSIILRISFTYGNKQKKEKMLSKLISNYKNSKKIVLHKYINGFQKMDLIHVDDVCNAIKNSINLKKSFGVYNISSGEYSTINDIITILKQNIKSNPKISVKNINQKINHFQYDISLASKDLKFKPKIPLKTGIRNLL
jgi:nucleoside-diphosphate-sugar epimerase